MRTRSQSRSRKQAYLAHLRNSRCRGKSPSTCRLRKGCKRTKSGRRKSYCRSRKNRHV